MEYWPAPRQASQPPTVDRSIDCGQWPRVRPCRPGGRPPRRAEGAGPDVGEQRVGVDVADAGQAAEVEGHPAEERDGGAAHAAAAAGRGHRHPGLVAQGEHGGHLRGVGGPGHHRRPGRDLAVDRPADGERPPVPAGLGPVGVVVRDHGADIGQPAAQRVVDGDPFAGQVVGDLGRARRRSG